MPLALIQIKDRLSLRLTRHQIVRISLSHMAEAQSLVELKRPMVLQSGRKSHLLTPCVSLSNYISQETSTDTMTLVAWQDLDLTYLYCVGLIEYLNHAHSHAIHFDTEDSTAFPAFSAMSQMPSFIPAAPRGEEQVPVHGSAQLLEPWFVLRSRWNQVMSHSLAPRSAAGACQTPPSSELL